MGKVFRTLAGFSLFIGFFNLEATHLRGGYIEAKSISQLSATYEITIHGYTDSGSDIRFGGGILTVNGTEIEISGSLSSIDIGNGFMLNSISTTHTFPTTGTYVIGYQEENRNVGALNLLNSENTSFYVETTIVVDPFLGFVNTGKINDLILSAVSGQTYYLTPRITETDGDLLQFRFTAPRSSGDTFAGYLSPIDPSLYDNFSQGNQDRTGPPSFSVNKLSGMITWDAPQTPGLYNLALAVSEYRETGGSYFFTSRTILDFQVEILAEEEYLQIDLQTPDCIPGETPYKLSASSQEKYSMRIYPEAVIDQLNGNDFDPGDLIGLEGSNSISLTFKGDLTDIPVLIEVGRNDLNLPSEIVSSIGFFLSDRCDDIVDIEGIITSIDRGSGVTVFPNPASNYIQLEGHDGVGEVILTDINGKVLLEMEGNITRRIDLSRLDKGLYIIRISTSQGKTFRRIVVK